MKLGIFSIATVLCMSVSVVRPQTFAQDKPEPLTAKPTETKCTIFAIPTTVRPLGWKEGEKVTIGVRLIAGDPTPPKNAYLGKVGETLELPEMLPASSLTPNTSSLGDGPASNSETRVIGIATDVLLESTNEFPNRTEITLHGTPEQIRKIVTAAGISELWFEVMPYSQEHKAAFTKEVDVESFMKDRPQYRPADQRDWGFRFDGGKQVPPPTQEQVLTLRNDRESIRK